MLKRGICYWVTAILLLLPATASAATPGGYVKEILDKVMVIQNNPSLAGEAHKAARAQAIRLIIKDNFDFSLMGRDSLGSAYERLSPGQRREFEDTFSRLFQDSYSRLVLNFLKKENIQYQQEANQGTQARVKTTLVRTNESIPVEYLMHSAPRGWILYDVQVDGVSILNNYKSQFARTIQAQSFDYLLQKMKVQAQAMQ